MELCRVYLWLEQKKLTVLECVLQQQPAAVVLLWFSCGSAVVLLWFWCGSAVVLMWFWCAVGILMEQTSHETFSHCRAAVWVTWLMSLVGSGPSAGPAPCSVCVSTTDTHTTHTNTHTYTHTRTHTNTHAHTHGLSAGLVWVSAVAELIKSLSLCSLFH